VVASGASSPHNELELQLFDLADLCQSLALGNLALLGYPQVISANRAHAFLGQCLDGNEVCLRLR